MTRSLWALALLILVWLPVGAAWAGPVAVLYFDNQGNPALEPLRVGLAQMFVSDLKSDPTVEVVERERLQAVLDELALGHSGRVDRDTAGRIGKLLGAEYLLLGSYFELAGTLRIDARLVRVETGEVVQAAGRSGTVGEFGAMQKALVGAFLPTLGHKPEVPATAAPLQRAEGDEVARKQDAGGTSLVAPLAFSRALVALDGKKPTEARALLAEALAADPSFAPAEATLRKLDGR